MQINILLTNGQVLFVIFLNSVNSAAALVFYLPGLCTYTDTEGKQRKGKLRNFLKSSKKTQYLMNTLYIFQWVVCEEKMFPNTHGRVLVNDDDPSKVRSKIVQSVHNFLPAPLYGFFNPSASRV